MDRKYGRSCARLLQAVAEGKIQIAISGLVLLEVANALRKYGLEDEVKPVLVSIPALPMQIHSIDSLDVKEAVRLFDSYRISPYDCAHAAIMIREGIRNIISADGEFDKVREVIRTDPLSFWI